MKKKKVLLCLAIIGLIVFYYKSVYAATSPTGFNGMFPDFNSLKITSSQPKRFNQYPLTHYMFDSDKFSLLNFWAYAIKALTNFLFMIVVFISYVVNYLLMACFRFNIFQLVATGFDDIVWAVRDAVFTPLLQPALVIVGIAMIFNLAIGKQGAVWRILFNTIAVLAISAFFFVKPSMTMTMVNDTSQSISGDILAKTSSLTSGTHMASDDAVVNLGNTFWDTTVIKPWQLIEFGDVTVGQAQMDTFLKESASSSVRTQKAKDLAKTNELFTANGSITRLAMTFFIGIIALVLDIFVLILAAVTVMLQFGAIVSAIIMVIAFLIALLPNMGFRVAVNSLYSTFGFLTAKIAMTILLSVYFSINTAIYKLTATYGWMIVTILQILLIGAIILYRNKIMGFAHSVTGGQQKAIENIHRKRDGIKDLATGAAGLYGAKTVYSGIQNMREARTDKKLTEKYKPMAQDYLTQRYSAERKAAEDKASDINEQKIRDGENDFVKPEYSNFVKSVDGRVDKGFTPFDEREVNRTVEMMKGLHRQGNSPENLLTTNIEKSSGKTLKYKQRSHEKNLQDAKESLESRQNKNNDKIDKYIKSDKKSNLYNFKTAASGKLVGYLDDDEDYIISSNRTSAMDELRNQKINEEYNKMKREESISQSEENKEEIQAQMAVGETGRPIGKVISVDGSGTRRSRQEVASTAHTSSISTGQKIIEKQTVNSTKVSAGDKISEHRKVKNTTEKVVEKSINNLEASTNEINRTESISNQNNIKESITEQNQRNTKNITNENKNIKNNDINETSKIVKNAESVSNTTNKTENIINEKVTKEVITENNHKNIKNVKNIDNNIKNINKNDVVINQVNESNSTNIKNINNNEVRENTVASMSNRAVGRNISSAFDKINEITKKRD